jgi:hypothetical protein
MMQNWKNRKSEMNSFRSGFAALPCRDFIKATGVLLLTAGTGGCRLSKAEQKITATVVPAVTRVSEPITASPSLTPSPSPASSAPTPSPSPQPVRETSGTQVAFVKTTDRAEGVRRALNLLGTNPVDGKTVMLKPNFNSADYAAQIQKVLLAS